MPEGQVGVGIFFTADSPPGPQRGSKHEHLWLLPERLAETHVQRARSGERCEPREAKTVKRALVGFPGRARWQKSCFRTGDATLWDGKGMAGTTGLEPATSDVTGRRSNQLNYARNKSPTARGEI